MLEPGALSLRATVPPREPAAAPATRRTRPEVLHIVTDALPSTSAGYTIRTQEIALAQRAAGLDPHVITRIGFPVTAGAIDGRATVTVDGVPYHRLLPWVMPGRMDRPVPRPTCATPPRLTGASCGRPCCTPPPTTPTRSSRSRCATRPGCPVVYEVRGFWEDTWLSRHAATADLKRPTATCAPARSRRTA